MNAINALNEVKLRLQMKLNEARQNKRFSSHDIAFNQGHVEGLVDALNEVNLMIKEVEPADRFVL